MTLLTYLQVVNRVLARLRENAVATYTETTYSTLIGALVNQVKSEIEDAYYWNALRDTYTITTTVSTTSYAFTGAGAKAVVLEGWNTTWQTPLERGTNAQFNEWYYGTTSIQTGPVTNFIPAGLSALYDLKVDVWPAPEATAQTLKFSIYAPQADLSSDADVPLVPQTVLIEETIARALNERGDDSAPKPQQPGDTFLLRELLQSYVAREAGHDDEEMDWIAD